MNLKIQQFYQHKSTPALVHNESQRGFFVAYIFYIRNDHMLVQRDENRPEKPL